MDKNPLVLMMSNRRDIHELLRRNLIEPQDNDEPVCKETPVPAETQATCSYCCTSIKPGEATRVIQEEEDRRRKYVLHEHCYNIAQGIAKNQSRRR